jgi:hypothetical protein
MVKGSWSHDNERGTELSISFPDGKIGGRDAPKNPESAEGIRDATGSMLVKKIGDCRKLANLALD